MGRPGRPPGGSSRYDPCSSGSSCSYRPCVEGSARPSAWRTHPGSDPWFPRSQGVVDHRRPHVAQDAIGHGRQRLGQHSRGLGYELSYRLDSVVLLAVPASACSRCLAIRHRHLCPSPCAQIGIHIGKFLKRSFAPTILFVRKLQIAVRTAALGLQLFEQIPGVVAVHVLKMPLPRLHPIRWNAQLRRCQLQLVQCPLISPRLEALGRARAEHPAVSLDRRRAALAGGRYDHAGVIAQHHVIPRLVMHRRGGKSDEIRRALPDHIAAGAVQRSPNDG